MASIVDAKSEAGERILLNKNADVVFHDKQHHPHAMFSGIVIKDNMVIAFISTMPVKGAAIRDIIAEGNTYQVLEIAPITIEEALKLRRLDPTIKGILDPHRKPPTVGEIRTRKYNQSQGYDLN